MDHDHTRSFAISDTGIWLNPTLQGHCHDLQLCKVIALFLKSEALSTVVDLGCGPGDYVKGLRNEGLTVEGYDGNPFTTQISRKILGEGPYCKILDLTKEVIFKEPFDCVLSLEVGEHIPAIYEDIFLNNITCNTKKCIILSWAVEGQRGDGHVNCHNNAYINEKMQERRFIEYEEATTFLRSIAILPWFQKTLMVFWNEKYF